VNNCLQAEIVLTPLWARAQDRLSPSRRRELIQFLGEQHVEARERAAAAADVAVDLEADLAASVPFTCCSSVRRRFRSQTPIA
jgi:hypothetical protein